MSAPPVVLAAYASIALAWSGAWVVGKLGVTDVPPLELSAIRHLGASVALFAVARATRTPLGGAPLGAVVAAAFFGYFGYSALVFVGLTMAPASDAALIVPTTIPVLTAVSATFVGEPLTREKVAGFATASIGTAIVVGVGQLASDGSPARLIGDAMMLGGAMCFAAYTTIGKVALRDRSPLAVVTLATPLGALMLLPLGLLEHGYGDVPAWSSGAWFAVAYLGIVVSAASYVAFFHLVRRYGAGLASLLTYLVPLGTLALAFVVLGDRPAPLQLVGGAVILLGVRIATRRRAVDVLDEAPA